MNIFEELVERCLMVKGPDRGIDGRIAYALGWRFSGFAKEGAFENLIDNWQDVSGHWARPDQDFCPPSESFDPKYYPPPPCWTGNSDIAMTLVPEVQWTWGIVVHSVPPSARVTPRDGQSTGIHDPRAGHCDKAATVPLAICIAILKARSALFISGRKTDTKRLKVLLGKASSGDWQAGHLCDLDHPCDCPHIFCGQYMGGIGSVTVNNGKLISEGGNDAPDIDEARANLELIVKLKQSAPQLIAAMEFAQSIVTQGYFANKDYGWRMDEIMEMAKAVVIGEDWRDQEKDSAAIKLFLKEEK